MVHVSGLLLVLVDYKIMNFWTKVAIWILWLVLFCWWLTPEVNHVKDQINQHNAEIKKALEE